MVESGSIKLPRIVEFVAEARLHFIVVVRKRRSASPDLVQPDRAQSLFAATNDDNVVVVTLNWPGWATQGPYYYVSSRLGYPSASL